MPKANGNNWRVAFSLAGSKKPLNVRVDGIHNIGDVFDAAVENLQMRLGTEALEIKHKPAAKTPKGHTQIHKSHFPSKEKILAAGKKAYAQLEVEGYCIERSMP